MQGTGLPEKELVIYMDGDAGRYWQILFYILLIIGGAYFASAESAYVRANKIRLKSAADDGDKRAKRALYTILSVVQRPIRHLL